MKAKSKYFLVPALLFSGIIIGFSLSFLIKSGMFAAGNNEFDKSALRKAEFITVHTLCGHESVYTESGENQATFKNEDEIKKAFPEWTLETVSNEKFVLRKQTANYCPHHYLAYLKDKKIYIETLNGDKKEVLNIAFLTFTPEEEKNLTDGVYLNGQEMYTAFIEDFTS